MEETVPVCSSSRQEDLRSQDVIMQTFLNMNLNLNSELQLENHSTDKGTEVILISIVWYEVEINTFSNYESTDEILAVKLDPAIIEARVAVETLQESDLERSSRQSTTEFNRMLSIQATALQSLAPQQFSLILKYVDTMRKQRISVQRELECGFCKSNGQPMMWYSTHSLKDKKGRVRCPVLRGLRCRRCGATGDSAHTYKYCPQRDVNIF